jgi:hypothetical protein
MPMTPDNKGCGGVMDTRTVKTSVIAASLAMLALVLQVTVSAHHSFAMYDQKKVVTLTGVVKQFVPQANHAEITSCCFPRITSRC